MDFNHIREILEYEVFGISLIDPIIFFIKSLIIFLIIQIAVAIINFLFNPKRKINKKHKMEATTATFMRRLLTSIVYILGIAYILFLIPGLRTIGTSILASAGILAMAVGLASQEALSNFVGGIFIIAAKPFRIDDYVELESGVKGFVNEITLRHTVIRTSENQMVIIPNSTMNSSIITNSTIKDTRMCEFIEVSVSYKENLDRCITEMRNVIERDERVVDNRTKKEKEEGKDKVVIKVIELGSSAIRLRAYVWANDRVDGFYLKCDLLKAIKDHFDEVGIEIPYPYMNVVNKNT